MSTFYSNFDDYEPFADSFSPDQDPSEWGEVANLDPTFVDDFPEWDDIVPDLEAEYGDLYRGPFGSTGSDGESFYYFDSETGASVVL